MRRRGKERPGACLHRRRGVEVEVDEVGWLNVGLSSVLVGRVLRPCRRESLPCP